MKLLLPLLLPTVVCCAQAVQGPARIVWFQAVPAAVVRGGTVTLRWSAAGTDRVRLEPPGLDLPAVGEVTQIVNERAIFWLQVSNLAGGQSAPAVVELLPDPPAAATPGPIPAAEAPSAAVPAAPAAPASRPGHVQAAAGAWIQFAALADAGHVQKLREDLERLAGIDVSLWPLPGAGFSGQPTLRLRAGPYATLKEARRRLAQLRSRLRTLSIKPYATLDP